MAVQIKSHRLFGAVRAWFPRNIMWSLRGVTALPLPPRNPVFDTFAARIHERYEPVLRNCMQLVAIGNELFSRPVGEPLHKVTRAIGRVVVNSNGAVINLLLNGYGNDAMKVARSMFEGAVTCAYLRKHPDRVTDYLHYDLIRRWKLYKFMAAETPEYVENVPTETVEAMRTAYDENVPRFTRKNGTLAASWRKDTNLREMADEVQLGVFYVPFYGTASGIHHMDASGLSAQASERALDVEVAPSERYIHEALAMSHNVTWRVLHELNEESKLGMDREIEAAKDEFVYAWKAIRQDRE